MSAVSSLLNAKSSKELGINFANALIENEIQRETVFSIMGSLLTSSTKSRFTEFWDSFINTFTHKIIEIIDHDNHVEIQYQQMQPQQEIFALEKDKHIHVDNAEIAIRNNLHLHINSEYLPLPNHLNTWETPIKSFPQSENPASSSSFDPNVRITSHTQGVTISSASESTLSSYIDTVERIWKFIIKRPDHIPAFIPTMEKLTSFLFLHLTSFAPPLLESRDSGYTNRDYFKFQLYHKSLILARDCLMKKILHSPKSTPIKQPFCRILSIYCTIHYLLRNLLGLRNFQSDFAPVLASSFPKKLEYRNTTSKFEKSRDVLNLVKECEIMENKIIQTIFEKNESIKLDPLLYILYRFYPLIAGKSMESHDQDPLGALIEFMKRYIPRSQKVSLKYKTRQIIWNKETTTNLRNMCTLSDEISLNQHSPNSSKIFLLLRDFAFHILVFDKVRSVQFDPHLKQCLLVYRTSGSNASIHEAIKTENHRQFSPLTKTSYSSSPAAETSSPHSPSSSKTNPASNSHSLEKFRTYYNCNSSDLYRTLLTCLFIYYLSSLNEATYSPEMIHGKLVPDSSFQIETESQNFHFNYSRQFILATCLQQSAYLHSKGSILKGIDKLDSMNIWDVWVESEMNYVHEKLNFSFTDLFELMSIQWQFVFYEVESARFSRHILETYANLQPFMVKFISYLLNNNSELFNPRTSSSIDQSPDQHSNVCFEKVGFHQVFLCKDIIKAIHCPSIIIVILIQLCIRNHPHLRTFVSLLNDMFSTRDLFVPNFENFFSNSHKFLSKCVFPWFQMDQNLSSYLAIALDNIPDEFTLVYELLETARDIVDANPQTGNVTGNSMSEAISRETSVAEFDEDFLRKNHENVNSPISLKRKRSRSDSAAHDVLSRLIKDEEHMATMVKGPIRHIKIIESWKKISQKDSLEFVEVVLESLSKPDSKEIRVLYETAIIFMALNVDSISTLLPALAHKIRKLTKKNPLEAVLQEISCIISSDFNLAEQYNLENGLFEILIGIVNLYDGAKKSNKRDPNCLTIEEASQFFCWAFRSLRYCVHSDVQSNFISFLCRNDYDQLIKMILESEDAKYLRLALIPNLIRFPETPSKSKSTIQVPDVKLCYTDRWIKNENFLSLLTILSKRSNQFSASQITRTVFELVNQESSEKGLKIIVEVFQSLFHVDESGQVKTIYWFQRYWQIPLIQSLKQKEFTTIGKKLLEYIWSTSKLFGAMFFNTVSSELNPKCTQSPSSKGHEVLNESLIQGEIRKLTFNTKFRFNLFLIHLCEQMKDQDVGHEMNSFDDQEIDPATNIYTETILSWVGFMYESIQRFGHYQHEFVLCFMLNYPFLPSCVKKWTMCEYEKLSGLGVSKSQITCFEKENQNGDHRPGVSAEALFLNNSFLTFLLTDGQYLSCEIGHYTSDDADHIMFKYSNMIISVFDHISKDSNQVRQAQRTLSSLVRRFERFPWALNRIQCIHRIIPEHTYKPILGHSSEMTFSILDILFTAVSRNKPISGNQLKSLSFSSSIDSSALFQWLNEPSTTIVHSRNNLMKTLSFPASNVLSNDLTATPTSFAKTMHTNLHIPMELIFQVLSFQQWNSTAAHWICKNYLTFKHNLAFEHDRKTFSKLFQQYILSYSKFSAPFISVVVHELKKEIGHRSSDIKHRMHSMSLTLEEFYANVHKLGGNQENVCEKSETYEYKLMEDKEDLKSWLNMKLF